MRTFSPRVRFALVFGFIVLGSLLAIRTPDWIAHFDFGSLSDRAFARLPEGQLLPTRESFRASPFLLDLILAEGTQTELTVFEKPAGSQMRGAGEAGVRVYTEGPASILVGARSTPAGASPRLFVYDDTGRLIEAPTAHVSGDSFQYAFTISKAGLYRIRAAFRLEAVDRIQLTANLKRKEREHASYLRDTFKSLHLRIDPGQMRRLGELRMIQEAQWAANESKPRPHSLPSPKERVVGRVRTEGGSWALVSLALAGRNAEHRSESALPSLDIRILSGELPYGLRRFKLYLLSAKSFGADLVMESFLNDAGVLSYPSDITKVTLNEYPMPPMLLMGTIESSFFELSQRSEGPVVGYDSDAMTEDAESSHYVFESYYKKKKFPASSSRKISDPAFAESLCLDSWLTAFSFNMMFNGLHGLSQTDLKYHQDPVSDCYSPIIRDFNANIGAITRDGSDHSFFNALRALGTLAPDWRPDVPTFSSYFALVDANHRERDGFFWWTTMPATLNFFTRPENYPAFVERMDFWSSPRNHERVQNRLANFDRAAVTFGTRRIGDLGSTFRTVIPTKQFYALSPDPKDALRSLIRQASRGRIDPGLHSMASFRWRNERLTSLLAGVDRKSRSALYKKAPENILTFLYRHELGHRADYFFLERNLRADASKSRFALSTGTAEIESDQIIDSGSVAHSPEMWEIYLNQFTPHEKVRIHRFVLEKKDEYVYLTPKVSGALRYFGPDALALAPRSLPDVKRELRPAVLTEYFHIVDGRIRLRPNAGVVSSALEIPHGFSWVIEEPTQMKFSRDGCLIVRGGIRVGPRGSLSLRAEGKSWSGVHFHGTDDLVLERLEIRDVGHGDRTVTCGSHAYTGGVSLFESTIELRDSRISNARIEDALHLLRSSVHLHGVEIAGPTGDAIDADFSSLFASELDVTCGRSKDGGDGLDVSGTHAELDRVRIAGCADKNVSVGEGSWLRIRGSKLSGGNVGIAVKDHSYADVESTEISGNQVAIVTYVKKPMFASPELHVGKGVSLIANTVSMQAGE